MLKGKIYEYMKKYLDAYLYDFDESKLSMSFLSGAIQLADLHVRQDMANRLIDSFGIPISLKVGLIRNVSITFSVLSFWTSPLELVIDDVYLVMGPSTFFRSNEDSYIEETGPDLLNASYDSTNAFNVFDHEMKIKANSGGAMAGEDQARPSAAHPDVKAFEHLKCLAQSELLKERLIEEEKQVQNVRLIFRNIQLTISRVHIRYEDDYYQADLGKKFAFGVTLSSLMVRSAAEDWSVQQKKEEQNLQQQQAQRNNTGKGAQGQSQDSGGHFTRTPIDRQSRYRELSPDSANLLVKEVMAAQVQVYYDNTGQIIVPTALLEEAHQKGEPREVFQKVPIKEIQDRMASVFASGDSNENPRNPYLVIEHFQLSAHIFSYRCVNFEGLYAMLQSQMGGHGGQGQHAGEVLSARDKARAGRGSTRAGGNVGKATLYRELQELQFQYFRNEFSMKFSLSPSQNRRNIVVNVTPDLLTSLQSLNEYVDNYYIAQDLKQYRPQRKPITASQVQGFSKKVLKSESFQRKRRNIVRDWLYFIVWYVRLKRILDQHKSSSLPASPKSLLAGAADGQAAGTALKSPIQDPTQLTSMNLTFGLPTVQFKFFESNKKMQDFYVVASPNIGARGTPQSRAAKPAAQRIAALSLSFSNSFFSYTQNLLRQEFERDLRIRSMEAFLTKIQENDDDWGSNEMGAAGAYRGQGGRAGPGDRTARAGAGPKRDLALQFEPQQVPKGANRHNQLSNQYHQRLDSSMQSMFKTHKMSTQDFTLSQDYSHDHTRPPQPLPWDDEDAGEGDLLAYRQQQGQSIWTSLFNAVKDLFNMNSQTASKEEEEQAQLRELRRCPSQARNSIHRGIERGVSSGPAARDPGSPSAAVVGSGVKGRVSILQNAQLELTRVNRDNKQSQNRDRGDRNQPGLAFQAASISNFPSSFADRNRVNQTHDAIRDLRRAPNGDSANHSFHRQAPGANLGKSFSQTPQRELDGEYEDHFARLITTHQCVNPQTNQRFEITQYPIIRTDLQSGTDILALSMQVQKQSRMQLQCLVDRPLEITYCAQDVLDVLLTHSSALVQSYSAVSANVVQQQQIGARPEQRLDIVDFKPLWAIRRSLKWQLQKGARSQPRTSVKRAHRKVKNGSDDEGNIGDEEGENIIDEEAEKQNTLSYIRCKPSINQSHSTSFMGEPPAGKSRSHVGSTSQLGGQHGYLSSDNQQADQKLVQKSIGARGRFHGVHRLDGQASTSDQYLQDVILSFEKKICGEPGEQQEEGGAHTPIVLIEVNVTWPMSLSVLTCDGAARGPEYQSVCKLKVQPAQYHFARSKALTSFNACGFEFESTNRVRVLQLFAKQLQHSVTSFLENPLIKEHLEGERVLERLKDLIRLRTYQKKKLLPSQSIAQTGLFGFEASQDKQNFMSTTQQIQQNFKDMQAQAQGSSSTQKFGPGSFQDSHPFTLKGHKAKPDLKPKKTSLPSKMDTPGPLDADSSESSDSAKRRYANLDGEDEEQQPFEQTPGVPVQIKQVSQLNMQIIYNNITGTDEGAAPNQKKEKEPKKDKQKDPKRSPQQQLLE